MKHKIPTALLCIVLLLSLQGCVIGTRNESLPDVNRLDLRTASTPKIKLQSNLKGATTAASRGATAENGRISIETLVREANLAVPISTSADADMVLDANLYIDESGWPILITLFSLGTIPAIHTTEIRLEARVWRGTQQHAYILKENFTNTVWWPLIFIAPFKPMIGQPPVLENMYRSLVSRMKNDGLFD